MDVLVEINLITIYLSIPNEIRRWIATGILVDETIELSTQKHQRASGTPSCGPATVTKYINTKSVVTMIEPDAPAVAEAVANSVANLEKLKRKRAIAKGNLTRFKNFIDNLNTENPDLLELELRLRKLDSCWQTFSEIQLEIEMIDDVQENEQVRQNFENDYFKYETMAKRLLQPSLQQVASSVGELNNSSRVISEEIFNIKLPRINLPSFDGTYNNWLYFKDTFNSIVHDNRTISDVQKFHYLRSCLKGEAAELIKSLEVSSANYNAAWQLINARYENKNLLINNHIKSLFNLPTVNKESHLALRSLLDKLNNHLRALKVLELPVDHWDVIIIYMVTTKLDSVTRREWETKNTNQTKIPTLTELISFLNERCNLLENLAPGPSDQRERTKTKSFVLNEDNKVYCKLCSGNHYINKCERLLALPPDKRYSEIKSKNLCTNCLRAGHKIKTCTSSSNCKICTKRHHTLLHFNNAQPSAQITQTSNLASNNSNIQGEQNVRPPISNNTINNNEIASDANNQQQTLSHFTKNTQGQTLLCTAIVNINDKFGNNHYCRAVLDSASESHFCTEELANKLQVNKFNINIAVSGINKSSSQLTHYTNLTIRSNTNNYQTSINCLIIPRITDNIPSISFDINTLQIPEEIELADPSFNESNKVDLLIGAELFWRLIRVGQITLGKHKPILQNTVLGWVVSGELLQSKINCFSVKCNLISTSDIDNNLNKFWEIEERGTTVPFSSEEQSVEDYFTATTERGTDGKFIVRLPLKQSPNVLGESKQIALKRSDNINTLLNLCNDISKILNSAGFTLNKWASNSPDVLNVILDLNPNSIVNIGKNHETHSLGLLWKSNVDTLNYDITHKSHEQVLSKRSILSSIAQIFDPLGLVGPVIALAKMLLQRLWLLKVTWDEPLPTDISVEWQRYSDNLKCLNKIQVPRNVLCDSPVSIELHGFSDASLSAYGCCIYVRTVDGFGNSHVNLLCAKSKVSPLKCITIPRLELCGALLHNECELELRTKTVNSAISVVNKLNIFERYSSFTRLQRVFAYILRYKNNLLKSRNPSQIGPLTTNELNSSTNYLARLELSDLNTKSVVNNNSKLLRLNPFLDDFGLIRVGGRIRYSELSKNKKHPVVLPQNHIFSKLL
ncbi:hypothetical protein NQ317_003027, partial [Molorchus minor]